MCVCVGLCRKASPTGLQHTTCCPPGFPAPWWWACRWWWCWCWGWSPSAPPPRRRSWPAPGGPSQGGCRASSSTLTRTLTSSTWTLLYHWASPKVHWYILYLCFLKCNVTGFLLEHHENSQAITIMMKKIFDILSRGKSTSTLAFKTFSVKS